MEKSAVNIEVQTAIKTNWNGFAHTYDSLMQLNMLQTFTTLAVHTAANTRKRILEVACGSG